MAKDENFEHDGPAIVWFRNDLRLSDNPALHAACESGAPVLAIYVFDEVSDGIRALGGASHWWLHHSLKSFSADLKDKLGIELILRRGPAKDVISDLVDETKAASIVWNRRYGSAEIEIDSQLKADFTDRGLDACSFQGNLLHEPAKVQTKSGGPYRVYTPFWKALADELPGRKPFDTPKKPKIFGKSLSSDSLDDWKLLPIKPDWSGGIAEAWEVGEEAAMERAKDFIKGNIEDYADARNLPGIEGTSRLSPHLRWGEISPYQIWALVQAETGGRRNSSVETYLKEIVWREFSYHLLYHFPDLGEENHQKKFDDFPWRNASKNSAELDAWQRGQTGYPIVDAGMRQLYETGWMHNRVRMIVGSFLVKHLLLDWRHGENWFWDTLVDSDPASNSASWQWVAGSGADAAPYFRVFNPITQGEKFDSDGDYVRHWVPEIAKLPNKYLNKPWEAPRDVLAKAGVKLGETYPKPLVDHKAARERALDAFASLKTSNNNQADQKAS